MLLIDAGRLMAAPLGGPHPARRRASTPPSRSPSSPTRSATAAASSPSTTASAAGCRRGGGRRRRGARALRPRAAARRRRLRARLPDRRGRQARADRGLHRPAGGGRGAPAARRRAGARPPPRRDRRLASPTPTSTPSSRRRPPRPATSTAQAVALDVLARRARVAHGLERAGASVLEAPAGASPPPASAPTSRPRRARGSEARAPRHATSPQNTDAEPAADDDRPAEADGRAGTNPSTSPASTSHGIVPSTSSIAGRDSRRSDCAARQRPGLDQRPADPQAGARRRRRCTTARARRAASDELHEPRRSSRSRSRGRGPRR